jgi:glycosyltransferase involved in cell wall biosynthesis
MSRARRFVLLCPNYHPRTCGVGDHSMRLALELQRRGFEAQILTRAPATTHPEALSVDVIGEDGPTPMVIAARLRRTLLKNRPTDLIIQYTPQMLGAWRWGSPAVLWLAHAAHQAGINTTLLAHELFLPWRRRPDLALGAALLRGQLALLMKICNHVLVTMENRLAEIAPLATLMGLRRLAGVVRVGTNAIPLAPTRRAGRLRIGVFSTLASSKRFDVVLDCFEKVQAVHPHAELVLLGDLGKVDDPRVRGLRAAIAAHPAHDRIRVPGKLGLREIAHEVAEMDIYLFPMITGANTRSGTLPLALGTGLPVVATRSYETDGLFVDGENIAIADALTGEAFARAVLRLLDDPASADRISRGARTLHDTYLSWERIGDQLLEQI